MSKRKRITIKDVAKMAGVSTQTVSRVINERPDVADATREHVLLIIDRLGYRPSAVARSLIRQRSNAIGVVTAGLKYIGPSRTLNGIATAAEKNEYTVLLKELPRFDVGNVETVLDALLSRQVDGIIWAVPEIGNNRAWLRQQLPELNVPIVFLTMGDHPELTVVSMDNYLGGQMATQHLLDKGYGQIGHVSGPLAWWEAQERKAGWEDTLRSAGCPPAPHHAVEGNWSSSSGARAGAQLLQQHPEVGAIFVANDQMALGVLQVATQRGLSVPRDLGVIGFDGIPESEYFLPSLSTIDQDQHELGRKAVQALLEMMKSGRSYGQEDNVPSLIQLQPQLVERQSTQRPR